MRAGKRLCVLIAPLLVLNLATWPISGAAENIENRMPGRAPPPPDPRVIKQQADAAFARAPVMRVRAASASTRITEHPYHSSLQEAASDGAFSVPAWSLVKVLKKTTDNDCNKFDPRQTDQRSSCQLFVIVINSDGSPKKDADGDVMEGYARAGDLEAWNLPNVQSNQAPSAPAAVQEGQSPSIFGLQKNLGKGDDAWNRMSSDCPQTPNPASCRDLLSRSIAGNYVKAMNADIVPRERIIEVQRRINTACKVLGRPITFMDGTHICSSGVR
jgi:hypothetical protein